MDGGGWVGAGCRRPEPEQRVVSLVVRRSSVSSLLPPARSVSPLLPLTRSKSPPSLSILTLASLARRPLARLCRPVSPRPPSLSLCITVFALTDARLALSHLALAHSVARSFDPLSLAHSLARLPPPCSFPLAHPVPLSVSSTAHSHTRLVPTRSLDRSPLARLTGGVSPRSPTPPHPPSAPSLSRQPDGRS